MAPRTVVRDSRLITADGITLAPHHTVWVTVNGTAGESGSLIRIGPDGRVSTAVHNPPWLDYPTQLVLGRTHRTAFVVNGSYNTGSPNVVELTTH